jgi:hypothetical protein
MNTVLYFSANGAVYETRAYSKTDIDQLVRNQGLQCLTSADNQFDFWFSSTPTGCQRRINRSATEILLSSTSFSARSVPLLRGCVVVATHDSDGDLDGLSWQQLELLVTNSRSLTGRDDRLLNRRINRDIRRRHRVAEAAKVAQAAKTAQLAKAVPVKSAQPRTSVLL